MGRKRNRILVVGSHVDSGYSMLNFTRDNFALIQSEQKNVDLFYMTPKRICSLIMPKKFPRKYSVYVDKYLLFGPFLAVTTICLRINAVHALDHSDSIYRFFVPKWKAFWVTVHDLFAIKAALDQIPNVEIMLSGKIYQRAILNGLRKAQLAICISETTRKSLIQLLPDLKTVVLHNFVLETDLEQRIKLSRYPDQYFLILMNSHWRKNRVASIEVWKYLTRYKQFANSHLVIVGKELEIFESELIGRENLPKITVLQNLTSFEIQDLYRGCVAVINISKYEGFGMPIIEANLNKKICIYGGSPAFNEIAPPDNIDWFSQDSSIREEKISNLSSESAQSRVRDVVLEKYSGNSYRSRLVSIYEEETQ